MRRETDLIDIASDAVHQRELPGGGEPTGYARLLPNGILFYAAGPDKVLFGTVLPVTVDSRSLDGAKAG
ncbi:MAG: hypothetical protein CMM45_03205 [Rhodospirillaceae bacterium]|nr:hypothetical protein [Rhodospirillaceae bacterium]